MDSTPAEANPYAAEPAVNPYAEEQKEQQPYDASATAEQEEEY